MDSDKRHCKICKDLKLRIEVGKWNDKDKKYLDEQNLPWNGNCCGSCHREKMKKYMKLKRKDLNYFKEDT